jgi:hypothetical protein
MLRRLLQTIVMIPIAGALVAWAVANRQPVTVSFDPFDPANPAFAMTMPVYLMGFSILIAGVLLGGVAAWIEQGKWRHARARLAAELRVVRAELDHARRQPAMRDSRALERTRAQAGTAPPPAR